MIYTIFFFLSLFPPPPRGQDERRRGDLSLSLSRSAADRVRPDAARHCSGITDHYVMFIMLCERFTFDALHHCGLKVFALLFVQRVNTSTRSRDACARAYWRKFFALLSSFDQVPSTSFSPFLLLLLLSRRFALSPFFTGCGTHDFLISSSFFVFRLLNCLGLFLQSSLILFIRLVSTSDSRFDFINLRLTQDRISLVFFVLKFLVIFME